MIIKNGYRWDIYDKEAYNNETGKYKFKREYEFILKNSNLFKGKILDVAGGSGRFALPLQEFTSNITVIDHNELAINLLKLRSSQITSICADFNEIELQESFSLVLCIEAIGYFDNIPKILLKMTNLLQKDGRIILTINNPDSWRFLARKINSFLNKKYPYTEIKLSKFKSIISDTGLEIIEIKGMNWIPLTLRSNSKLVRFFDFFENHLRLNKWISQSPWILIALKKKCLTDIK